MSLASNFLKIHESLATALKVLYPNYVIAKSESELSMGNFPAIGIFLGISEHEKKSRTYVPIGYSYVLCTFDTYDFDAASDLLAKQQTMFDLLEDVISKSSYTVLTDIEPAVSIGIDAGTFITGWTTVITFNAP
jgi:hypothetical protein